MFPFLCHFGIYDEFILPFEMYYSKSHANANSKDAKKKTKKGKNISKKKQLPKKLLFVRPLQAVSRI